MKLKEALKWILDENDLNKLIKSYDIIGDIIVIKSHPELESKMDIIAEALHEIHPRVRTIATVALYARTHELYRTRELHIIWGDDNLETTHRESGCIFKVDLRQVFFSPRLSYERMRIARKVSPAETIINTFSGAGCFSIIIAKFQPQTKIYSIDVNPHAYEYMKENVALNNVDGRVIPILGDASEELKRLEGVADRVIMPLPEHACSFLPLAVRALKIDAGGVIHYYDVSFGRKGDDLFRAPLERVRDIISSTFGDSLSIELEDARILRSVAPRKYHVVLDLHVKWKIHNP